jgi:hypothetical protein
MTASSTLPDEHAPQSPTPAMAKSTRPFSSAIWVFRERRALRLVHEHLHLHAVEVRELARHEIEYCLRVLLGVFDERDAQALETLRARNVGDLVARGADRRIQDAVHGVLLR